MSAITEIYMMELNSKQLRYFLFSQYLADGFRITLEIALPVIICAQFGNIEFGYTLALGALCVSIADAPGPVEHKRNGMMACTAFVFVMALITGFVNNHPFLIGLLVVVASFFFTMLSVYGVRAASVGTAALLVMVLRLSRVVPPMMVVQQSFLILGGGIWYMLISLLLNRVNPYRAAQRALGDCIHETAKFLRIKAEFYENKPGFEKLYHELVNQQVIVNQKQDAVRELLFKNRDLIAESTTTGKLLILTFADLMELYEQITATWYDYESLREKFNHTGILVDISDAIRNIADELDNIGLAIQSNRPGKKEYALTTELEKIKAKIDALGDTDPGNLVLKKILVNMRNMGRQVNELFNYFGGAKDISRNLQPENYYRNFVSHQPIDPSLFRDNLHLESSVFRHALRMTITCITGFAIAKMISLGYHSYWILLTIIVILKPGFGLSTERNIQRIVGTVAGGIAGICLLAFIHDRDILFGIIVFCMLGTYTFQRLNYITMVIFTTPYLLILFNLLGLPFWDIARERLLDTFIGGGLAFFASYLLFPHWESGQLQSFMSKVLKANIDYLRKVKDLMCGKMYVPLEYKLVRKELYVSIANLAAAFHRMLSDPRSKQQNRQQVDQFVVLNHIFSSNLVSLSAGVRENDQQIYSREILVKMKRAIQMMEETMILLDAEYMPVINEPLPADSITNIKATQAQLSNQLDFINKVAADINRITKQILEKRTAQST